MRSERMMARHGIEAGLSAPSPLPALEKLLLAAICAATLFFAVVTPPFQAPDENQHYMKALLLSEGRMLAETRGGLIGADLPRAAIELHSVDFPTDVPATARVFDSAMLAKAWTADASRPGRVFAEFPNVASYAPTIYAPGAAGLLMGDAMGLPHLGAFYVGRIINAVTALALLCAALWLLPFGRTAMLGVALLPTFSYQIGSLSPDAVINGIAFVGLALALRIGFIGNSARRTTGLFIIAPMLALAKGVYLPLIAAGLRWPTGRHNGRLLVLFMAMAIGALTFIGWMKYSGGSQALYHIMSRKTGESVLTAPLANQLAVILGDPIGYVRILISSVVERAPVYVLQIVGRFGWNAILLPLLAYPLAGVMIVAAMASGAGERFGIGQRLWWIAVAVDTALLIETAMYLTGTPPAADFIQGTQGRYFLPLMPLLLLALSTERPMRGARPLFAGSALLLLAIASVSAFDSFWVRGFVTSDGMPPHSDPLRALLLPSPRW
ncbi:DUF2142 domain-containing protein [Sphingobium sp.]|uniref:DUF2142 domain-containing protein n=1 Tax=Sphingobium sp. TaxID=1912891 RepID=UPI003BB78185